MAFPGLKYASSGLLAALRLGRRTGKKGRTPPSPSPGAQEAVDAAASPVASLAPLTEIISTYLDPKEVERVREAYRFADQAHLGQFRASGAPYISHPIAVTEICAGWKLDANALSAALLHDVMEDQGVGKHELAEKFSPKSPNWSTACPNWTGWTSRPRPSSRPRAFARCCWPWRATCASS